MERRRSVRRIVARLIMFLLLGAIVNVAVAWGSAAYLHPNNGTSTFTFQLDSLGQSIAVSSIRNLGRKRVSFYPGRAAHPSTPVESSADIVWSGHGERGSIDLAGWPCAAFSCSNHSATVILRHPGGWIAFDGMPGAPFEGGILLSPWTRGSGMTPTWRALPLNLVMPGFAINTIMYAAILWLLFAAPGRIRRWWRVKRGLCPACAYPIGESATCTECGKPVPSKDVALA